VVEPATSPAVPPRSDRAVRAELEQVQARLRALQAELSIEHAAGFSERRAALERELAQAVAVERDEDAQVGPLLARERQLDSRIAVAKAELAQLAQRQLSPVLLLAALVGAYLLFDAVAPRVSALPLARVGLFLGVPTWFVFGLLFSLRVGGAAVTQPFPRVPSVLVQTVVLNPAAWAMPLLLVGVVAQVVVGSRLSVSSPARLVEHGWAQWPALLVVGLSCWGFRSKRGAQRVVSVLVGALAWALLFFASMRGPFFAQESMALMVAVSMPVLVASTWIFLTFLRVRTTRATWAGPAVLSVMASMVLSTNAPSFDESDLPAMDPSRMRLEPSLGTPSFITAREASVLQLREAASWPSRREQKGALLAVVQPAHYRDLAAFLFALQLGLAGAIGALLFTADERRAVRWRLFALVPFVVVALVSWARA
jgi:hypothetical protein